jgi:hypothetical protein
MGVGHIFNVAQAEAKAVDGLEDAVGFEPVDAAELLLEQVGPGKPLRHA